MKAKSYLPHREKKDKDRGNWERSIIALLFNMEIGFGGGGVLETVN